MALILNLETSTEICSVALARNGIVINKRENLVGLNHAMLLTVFINEILKESNISVDHLDAIAISRGPGSYTGLRIGVSVAKGICFALHLPLIAIKSLEAMAHHVIHELGNRHPAETDQILFCPMIDARRMEVYTSLYDKKGFLIRGIQADIIDQQYYLPYLNSNSILFFGNGTAKCRQTISHPNAIFIPDIFSSAIHMAPLSEQSFKLQHFSDVFHFEPFYLKDFVATVPLKNILKIN